MGEKDVFVKRVDFVDLNGKDDTDKTPLNEVHNSDVEKLTDPVQKPSCLVRFLVFIDKYGIKAALSHIGLLIALGLYCFAGGFVFVTLEKPGLNDTEFALRENVTEARQTFIDDVIYSMSTNSLSEANLNEMLELYERKAQEAVEGDLMLVSDDKNGSSFPSKGEKWTMLQAIFFASTVCTTIGYGNIAPQTFEGRIFCIFFALIGIPFTLTVIADYGNLFANSVSFLAKKYKSLRQKCRKPGEVRKKMKGRKLLYALSALVFLAFYLSAGAAVFDEWEDGWTFFDGFYFCFITVTTVGFGDLVPGDYLMLLCTLYILIGLALTSTIIELVRREYVRSWQKLQQLRLGRFAESLKKLGESHTQMDVNDIRHILAIMSRKDGKKDKKAKIEDTMDAFAAEFLEKVQTREKPKIVQIIIYETSV